MSTHATADTRPDLDAVERVIRSRRSIRNFKPDPVDRELLVRLLDAARWAPSGYNLQPTHMIVVTLPEVREALCSACMNQRQVKDAPVVVVFAGDARAHRHNLEEFLAIDRQAGAMNEEYEKLLRKVIPLVFSRGPLGLGWVWKSTLLPVARWFVPVPSLPAVHTSYWLGKQASMSAMNFMLAASAAGLATLPMEGFDTARVQRTLKLPRWMIPLIVVPTGYSDDRPVKTRFPLERMVHWEHW